MQVTNRPGTSGLAGVVDNKLIQFVGLYMLNYLSTLFETGLQYPTINSYRSAISAYHDYVDGKPVGKHPGACTLQTGAFNQRPPQPRYTFIWDVEIVLVYLKTNMSDNSQLSDKDLTHKLTVLMALSSASRVSSLQT